jgi:8-oxo-dGTP pyrophosphatase MutT (NUDIX family)
MIAPFVLASRQDFVGTPLSPPHGPQGTAEISTHALPQPTPCCRSTYELCAGLLNKGEGVSLAQHAAEEVAEEVGYAVRPGDLQPLFRMREAVGIAGTTIYVYYVAVDDAQKLFPGGGLAEEGESIQVVEVPASPAALTEFLLDDVRVKSPELQAAFLLWLCPPSLREAHMAHYSGAAAASRASAGAATAGRGGARGGLWEAALAEPGPAAQPSGGLAAMVRPAAWLAAARRLAADRQPSLLVAVGVALTAAAAYFLGMRCGTQLSGAAASTTGVYTVRAANSAIRALSPAQRPARVLLA